MLVALCIPLPFFVPCDDMLTMLVCATLQLSIHLYVLAYMSTHESCLLVCRPYFNTMKLWTSDPNLHQSLVDTIFLFALLLVCLLSCSLVCLLACLLAFLFLCLPCLSRLFALCLFHMLFASFPYIACLLVSFVCLCMYTHGARARSPRRKQKGRGCEHVDISQAAAFSRFRGLASPI